MHLDRKPAHGWTPRTQRTSKSPHIQHITPETETVITLYCPKTHLSGLLSVPAKLHWGLFVFPCKWILLSVNSTSSRLGGSCWYFQWQLFYFLFRHLRSFVLERLYHALLGFCFCIIKTVDFAIPDIRLMVLGIIAFFQQRLSVWFCFFTLRENWISALMLAIMWPFHFLLVWSLLWLGDRQEYHNIIQNNKHFGKSSSGFNYCKQCHINNMPF